LDGIDGSGKTTLAQALRQKEGYQIKHFGVPPTEALRSEQSIFRFYLDPMYEAVEGLVPHTVFDRSHLAEPIYGPVMRGGTAMTYRVEALLERYIEAVDGQIVICLPPYRVAFNNWVARKGLEYVKEASSFRKIYEGYAHLLFNQKRNHNFIWYDYTRNYCPSFANGLMAFNGCPLPAGVVGSQRPRFLFVGERPGSGNENRDLPFLSPENCSGFLFDCLQQAGYKEHELAFVNAWKGDGTNTYLGPILEDLYNVRKSLSCVIALGEAARKALFSIDAKCVPLAHPQHVKRFKSREAKRYIEVLKDLRRRSR
jgi:uracil-DNA glycosylase